MTAQAAIELAVQRLVVEARPKKIILFGSFAGGAKAEGSDLDFVVIERRVSSKFNEMVRLRRAVGSIGYPVDILVFSEDEVADWGHLPGTTIYWALKEGTVVYEAAP